MPHVRRQILDAAAAALTGLATTGANVFQDRAQPIASGAIPAVVVEPESEETENDTFATDTAVVQQRVLRFVVIGIGTDWATADQIGLEAEQALAGLSDPANELQLERVGFEAAGGGERRYFATIMHFSTWYRVQSDDPSQSV